MQSTYRLPGFLLAFGARLSATPGARRVYRSLGIVLVALLALRVFGLG